jgi:hypothetical protein
MNGQEATVALLVVAEHDIDPAAAFRSAAALSPRYYAPIRRGGPPTTAVRSMDGVQVIEAVHVEEAVQLAMKRTPGIPLLVLSAGETLVPRATAGAPSRRSTRRAAGAAPDAAARERPVPSRILVAGEWTRHAPWFGAVRAHVRVPDSHRGALPDLEVERRPADLSAALAASTRSALERQPAARRSGPLGILFAPVTASLRVYCGGAWRDGVRGLLLAALHGLSALVTVTSGSLATGSLSTSSLPARSLDKGWTS